MKYKTGSNKMIFMLVGKAKVGGRPTTYSRIDVGVVFYFCDARLLGKKQTTFNEVIAFGDVQMEIKCTEYSGFQQNIVGGAGKLFGIKDVFKIRVRNGTIVRSF